MASFIPLHFIFERGSVTKPRALIFKCPQDAISLGLWSETQDPHIALIGAEDPHLGPHVCAADTLHMEAADTLHMEASLRPQSHSHLSN